MFLLAGNFQPFGKNFFRMLFPELWIFASLKLFFIATFIYMHAGPVKEDIFSEKISENHKIDAHISTSRKSDVFEPRQRMAPRARRSYFFQTVGYLGIYLVVLRNFFEYNRLVLRSRIDWNKVSGEIEQKWRENRAPEPRGAVAGATRGPGHAFLPLCVPLARCSNRFNLENIISNCWKLSLELHCSVFSENIPRSIVVSGKKSIFSERWKCVHRCSGFL